MHIFVRSSIVAGLAGAALIGGCAKHSSVAAGNGYSVGSYNPSWGDPYWGWHRGTYYPGTGEFSYVAERRRVPLNDDDKQFWESRRAAWRGDQNWRDNWGDFGKPFTNQPTPSWSRPIGI